MTDFGALNWTILASYMAGAILVGFLLSKRVHTAQHYYLGQRTTPWPVIGLSVVATYVGALAFLGGPAWAYEEGFSVVFIHINYPIAIFVVITVFLPFFYHSGVASIFDYLERRFGLASRTLMSAIFLFGNLMYSGIMLYTAALVLEFITGMDVTYAILIVAAVALAYTLLGGISAVIWTDLMQTAVLFAGAFIIFAMVLAELPESLPDTLAALKAQGRTNPFAHSLDPSKVATIWTGLIAMSIYHVVVYGVNQMMVQRTLAARTLGDAKKAYILMGYAAFPIYALFFGLGLLFWGYYGGREFEDGNKIVLEFVAAIGLPGLMGLVTAAVVAAAMSSLDSSLNSMATVTTLDFYEKFFNKDSTPERSLAVSRWFTVFWGVLMVAPAILFAEGDGASVLEVLSEVGSFFVGAKLAMFGLGFYSKHTSQRGLMWGVAAGFLALAYAGFLTDLAWPWYCALGGAVSIAVAWSASLLLDGRQADWHPYSVVGQQRLFKQEGWAQTDEGWQRMPGKVDRASYFLLGYFVLCVAALWLAQSLI